MARVWFSRGTRGMIATRIQADLLRQGFFDGQKDSFVDGDFGGHTEAALKKLQSARNLASTGSVNEDTWKQLTSDSLPDMFERSLAITADFEGHGFGLLQGNFDGAGWTWGIIGFTLASNEIQRILARAEQEAPGTLARVMGPLAAEWADATQRSLVNQIKWADSLSRGPTKEDVTGDWKKVFRALGDEPVIQRIQLDVAREKYFKPALATAGSLGLRNELSIALCFDMHVQNYTSRLEAVKEIKVRMPFPTEGALRVALANAVADRAAAQWREDVRARKLTLASGSGVVHARAYHLAAWGLDEFPAMAG